MFRKIKFGLMFVLFIILAHTVYKYVPIGSNMAVVKYRLNDVYKKSVESILSLVPRYKGLRIALIVETSNAESPTPMYVYNSPH